MGLANYLASYSLILLVSGNNLKIRDLNPLPAINFLKLIGIKNYSIHSYKIHFCLNFFFIFSILDFAILILQL